MGESEASFTCDNCPGQNKNWVTMCYFMWQCATDLHDRIDLEFMEKGHTKCRCDGCFGLAKKCNRRHDIDSMPGLTRYNLLETQPQAIKKCSG